MNSRWMAIGLAGSLMISPLAMAQESLPPRSVSDVRSSLARAQRAGPAEVALADRAAPGGASAADLARFYRERGQAAEAIGRDAQALADFSQALAKARQANLDLAQFLTTATAGEMGIGNYLNAQRLYEELFAVSSKNQIRRIIALKGLIEVHLRLGDIRQAEAHLAEIEKLSRQAGSWSRDLQIFIPAARYNFQESRARYFLATGNPTEAEAAARSALEDTALMVRTVLANPSIAAAVTIPILQEYTERRILLLADTLVRQGRLVEAETEVRRAFNKLLERGTRGAAHASTLIGALADVMIEQGRFNEAEALARDAEAMLAAVVGKDTAPGGLLNARLRIGQVLALRGDRRQAGEVVASIVQGPAGEASALFRFSAFDPVVLPALAAAGHGDKAESAARVLLEIRRRAMGDGSYATAEARGFHAAMLSAVGRKADALEHFRLAMPVLLAHGTRAEDQIAVGIRLQAIVESYLALLFELKDLEPVRRTDIAAETFQLAELVRGRAVQRAIAASAARVAAKDQALAGLARREQDLNKRVAALNQTLLDAISLPPDQQVQSAQAELRAEIERATTERASAAREIAKRFPVYSELTDPRPATLADARAALTPSEAMVTFLIGAEQGYVWAVPGEGTAVAGVVKLDVRDLSGRVAKLRLALAPQALSTEAGIPPFDVSAAHELYRNLLGAVAPALAHSTSLLVVPHGPLGQLPLGLLVSEKPAPLKRGKLAFSEYRAIKWLIRSKAVTQLPSVATFTMLRRLPASRPGRLPLIAFADPVFAPRQADAAGAAGAVRSRRMELRALPSTADLASADLAKLPRLPDTADEVRAVAAALGADPMRDLFLGPRASENSVLTADLSNRRVVMFATHGLVAGDLDGLAQPALALSSPSVSGGEGDGLLTMEEVLRLRLDADWVVLSACNTASASGTEGAAAEQLSGLGRAFFYAGARTMLVSNWPVESTSATALTTGLFRRLAADPRLSRAEALRQSMLAAIDAGTRPDENGKPVFAYAHPLLWAPFSVVGDGWSMGMAN